MTPSCRTPGLSAAGGTKKLTCATKEMNAAKRGQIDEAIRIGATPRRTSGQNVILNVPGARYRTLVSAAGKVTAAGAHYYDGTGQEPERLEFDYGTTPYRRRKRELIKMSNGKEATVRSWDNACRKWKFTKTGRAVYKDYVDRYLIKFPAIVHLHRKNGSWYTREDSLPSSATPLGEISVPTTLTEAQQLARLRRQVDAFSGGAGRRGRRQNTPGWLRDLDL